MVYMAEDLTYNYEVNQEQLTFNDFFNDISNTHNIQDINDNNVNTSTNNPLSPSPSISSMHSTATIQITTQKNRKRKAPI